MTGQINRNMPREAPGSRPCNVLAIAESLIASVELCAGYPLRLLEKQGLCNYRYRDVIHVAPEDMVWSDVLVVVRGSSCRTLGVVRQAKLLGRFVSSHWDDDPFHVPRSSLSHGYFADPGVQKTVRRILRESDLLTCSAGPLSEELFRQTGRRPLLLTVPAIDPVAEPPLHLNDPPRIGYAGGMDHKGVLEEYVVPALELLRQRGRQFSFELIGPMPAMSDALRERTNWLPHTKSYAEWIGVRNALNWDMFLTPLEENSFTACKFHNKLLEMASAGLAGIFSNVMPYVAAVEDGVNGLLTVNTPAAWADCIEKFMDDPGLRRQIAVNAWSRITRENSPDAVTLSFRQHLHQALAHRAPGSPRVLFAVPWRLVGKPWMFVSTIRALGLNNGLRRLAGKFRAVGRRFGF